MSRPREPLLFCFQSVWWKLGYIYVCLFVILALAKSVMRIERKKRLFWHFWDEISWLYRTRCVLHVKKQMAFVSCLAPRGHELLELLMFFLSPDPDPLHQLCSAVTLGVVHLAFYERTYFSLFFLRSIFQATSERQTSAQERQDDRWTLFVSVPITQNNTSCVWEKKKGFLVKLVAEAKIQLLGKENGSCRASLGLMASLKYFSFCAPDFVPSSRLFTCQRNRVLRCRPGCTCKMFPIVFLLFVPVLVPLLLCRDEWRPRRGLRDAEGTGLDYWKLVSSSALQKETQKVSCWTY